MNFFYIIFLVSLVNHKIFAHDGLNHNKALHDSINVTQEAKKNQKTINKSYLMKVKPLLVKACFDCHSNTTTYPWYYNIPGVRVLIDKDINEARKHLDFSHDFPFQSHDSPKNDLKAISKSIINKRMPPYNYKIMHFRKKLTKEEESIILLWVKTSIKKLNHEK